ncbi:hypothetical protein C4K09_0641 [Pseudomonas chlororaphis subsp. aureofaciens]|nr:hypothetical protein C4K09_0641 [Pseudomonas chlororaphis subsp. aureofaciens]
MVSPLRRLTFYKRLKSKQKRLPLRTAFAALRFPRSGVHQGASTPVGFASTSIRCPRLRRGALRAIPLMNTSARPPDGAGGSRSKAKAKAKAGRDLPVGAKPCSRCRAPARLRSTAKRAQGSRNRRRTFGPIAASLGLGSGYRRNRVAPGRYGKSGSAEGNGNTLTVAADFLRSHSCPVADASAADLSRSESISMNA